jgi:repressor LexA
MQAYFKVTPPSVHQMVLTLEAKGLIERTPGTARSIRVLLAREDLPALEQDLTSQSHTIRPPRHS